MIGRLPLVLLGAAILAGCSALEPYATAPAAVPAGAANAGPRVAICYNTLATPLAEVKVQAQRECAAGSVAEPARTDWYLEACPLLLPARATFVCAAGK